MPEFSPAKITIDLEEYNYQKNTIEQLKSQLSGSEVEMLKQVVYKLSCLAPEGFRGLIPKLNSLGICISYSNREYNDYRCLTVSKILK